MCASRLECDSLRNNANTHTTTDHQSDLHVVVFQNLWQKPRLSHTVASFQIPKHGVVHPPEATIFTIPKWNSGRVAELATHTILTVGRTH